VASLDPSLAFLSFGNSPDSRFVASAAKQEHFNYQEPDLDYYLQMNEDDNGEVDDSNDLAYSPNAGDLQPEDGNDEEDGNNDDDDPDFEEGTDLAARDKSKSNQKPKARQQSMAWQFFEKLNDSAAKCNMCGAELRAKRGSTTGMLGHLKSLHRDVYVKATTEQGITHVGLLRIKPKVEPFDGAESHQKMVRPKPKRSLIWNYFVPVENDEAAMCFSCGDICKTTAGNTTTLISHLKLKHPDNYEELQLSQNEEHLVKARQKLLGAAPKSLSIFSDDGSAKAVQEMSQEAVKSSPVWTIFKQTEEGEGLKVKCTLCEKVFIRPESSTHLLIHHLRTDHSAAFSHIKIQLENPDLPETFDPANPIWEFFTISDGKLAQCNYCLEVLDTQASGTTNLSNHLGSEHQDSHDSYKMLCTDWQQHRHEEYLVYQQNDRNHLHQIWNYFEATDNKHEVICKACKTIVLFSERSLAEINQHIEQDHPDVYIQFLEDTTGFKVSPESNIAERTCPDCQKVFSRRSSMLTHQKTVHATVHPYQCHVCGKTFARPDGYRTHIHIRLKSYLCTHCGKIFTSSHKRNQHEQAHFAEKRENPKTEKCSFCGKGFSFKHNRMRHEKTHSGLKPFQCTNCGKCFSQKHHLQAHQRTHSGDKPFECSQCGKFFKFMSSKSKHICDGKQHVQAADQLVSEDDSITHDAEEESSEGWE